MPYTNVHVCKIGHMNNTENRTPRRAIGYCRVSTDEQGESGAGLESQEQQIRAEAAHRGWDLIDVRTDVASGKSVRKRPALGDTLRDLAEGRADTLVIAKLDRLSRSVMDFASMMETAKAQGWSVVVLDLSIDMTTTNGELIANIMISLAQWERRLIGDRTRAGLAAVRARGTRLGRPSGVSEETMRLIRVLRTSGKSYAGIAETLSAEGIPTSQGGQWRASTVRKLLGV